MRERYGGRPVVLALLEEGAEVYGALAFVASGLVYALGGRPSRRISWAPPPRLVHGIVAGVVVTFACGALALESGLEALGVPFGGTPSGWFGGVGALFGGPAAFGIWRRERGARPGSSRDWRRA